MWSICFISSVSKQLPYFKLIFNVEIFLEIEDPLTIQLIAAKVIWQCSPKKRLAMWQKYFGPILDVDSIKNDKLFKMSRHVSVKIVCRRFALFHSGQSDCKWPG